jgi:aminoglycoside phosphotransferase (APT) family kinase protein
VRRWVKQWDATRIAGHDRWTRSPSTSPPACRPPAHAVVHGDYRLDNTVLDPTGPGRIAAVLDWEMSTLGTRWPTSASCWATGRRPTTAAPGATRRGARRHGACRASHPPEVAERYAARTGLDLTPLPWYAAFAAFKLAVVCAGIVARVQGGAMVGDGFDGIEERIAPLSRSAGAPWRTAPCDPHPVARALR